MAESTGKLAFKGTAANGRWNSVFAESAGLGVAELISIGVSLGVVGMADQVAPNLLKNSSKVLGKIIEPYLDNVERGLKTVCKLEECQPDENTPRLERAEKIAKTMIIFGTAWSVSMGAKIFTRKWINEKLKLTTKPERTGNWWHDIYNDYLKPSSHDTQVLIWDEGVHYGSLLLLNTGLSKITDNVLHATSGVLQKCGISKNKANEMAAMAVIWEVPNLLGFAAGAGRIAHHHLNEKPGITHVEQLAQQSTSAISSTLLHT